MNRLTSEWNEFKRALYFSQVLLTPAEVLFGGTNNEMINTMSNRIHLYKELEEKQVEGEFTVEKGSKGG